ncbi:prepilin peptidase [Algisphaera agarilytica]|uniref:Prepilin peptidase CpaA n=1 Tax=Algisphaera agarilytica TaxID=1385975 RepID=A0A7X0H2U7_9BACT|nr:A24 family peptidase [Algisphaera agarilytica]MBB6428262.1 prepilin peptidase CpaA [Algisphaera agarilytica]
MYSLLMIVVAVAAVIDWRTQRVPNRLTYPAILAGLIIWPIAGAVLGGGELALELGRASWIGMLCGLIPFALLVMTAGLGGGDMKLMAAVGSLSASWEVVLSTTIYALVVAVVMAVVVMVRKGVVKETLSRVFSAALLASAKVKAELPEDGPKVAFAAAVAVGAAIAGAEQMLGLATPWRGFSP